MKTKKTILSLAISVLLTAGVASYTMPSYADNDDNNHHNSSDSDSRGNSNHAEQKITVCHVPPGNPGNKHTIHIAYSAWAAHKAHTNTNTVGQPRADYLGSCNNPPITPTNPTTTSTETLHVISGCTGSYRDTLVSKVQSYFEPITVIDTVLDGTVSSNEAVITQMSQCLDKGDSSDSTDNGHNNATATGGKGRGHDSVSDSAVPHHQIRGCQNKNSGSDSDKDYSGKLKTADTNNDTAKSIKDPIVVADSSLDDSGVWPKYKACVKDSNDANKIDSSKSGKKRGDSGHKQHILKTSCGATEDVALKAAITDYKAKEKTKAKDIVLNSSSYNDVVVQAAVADCVNVARGGGKDTVTTSGTGVSGRINFRENNSPIKDVIAQ